jgi:simple sugar transport system permease protein
MDALTTLLETVVRLATPLALAALGELIVERCGIINVGLEGVLLGGCLGTVLFTLTGGIWLGLGGAIFAGMFFTALFGLFVVNLRGDQIITGTAVTLAAYGLTGVAFRVLFGDAGIGLSLPTMRPVEIPGLVAIPVMGRALFAQPPLTYAAYVACAVTWWCLLRTPWGLQVRAIGEYPSAAIAAGVRVTAVRWSALGLAGMFGGLAGASLVHQAGTFTEQMSAGRGFIAIGIVTLGRWHPVGAVVAALIFGAASALQFRAQGLGLDIPYQFFLAAPYAIMLLVLSLASRRAEVPAALGRNVAVSDAALR